MTRPTPDLHDELELEAIVARARVAQRMIASAPGDFDDEQRLELLAVAVWGTPRLDSLTLPRERAAQGPRTVDRGQDGRRAGGVAQAAPRRRPVRSPLDLGAAR